MIIGMMASAMMTYVMQCPAMEWKRLEETKENPIDQVVWERAIEKCYKSYKESPCVKSIAVRKDLDYRVICGKAD